MNNIAQLQPRPVELLWSPKPGTSPWWRLRARNGHVVQFKRPALKASAFDTELVRYMAADYMDGDPWPVVWERWFPGHDNDPEMYRWFDRVEDYILDNYYNKPIDEIK
jgi:hypothetical protein